MNNEGGGAMRVEIEIPGEAPSAANLREHPMARHRRILSQRGKVTRRMPDRKSLPVCIVVTLTRVAPRELDDDNLRSALKGHRDAVATWLRVDDASPLVRWEYAQERGEPGVRIEVEFAGMFGGMMLRPSPDTYGRMVAEREAALTGAPTPNVRRAR